MIENLQCSISGHALSLLAKSKIVAFICDDVHIPVGVLNSFQSHSTQLNRINEQYALSQPFKNRIWQKIVKQKIINQAKVLELNNNLISNTLRILVNRVESGDKTNVEGYASRIYFQNLFGSTFNRKQKCIENACLNYGYTILRGFVARSLVAYGFIPSVGIHHKNEFNNYNLADDFIESFRPIIDLWVSKNINSQSTFSKKKKYGIMDIVNYNILMKGKKYSVSTAIDMMISSYVKSISTKNIDDLELPDILDLNLHKYE